MDIRMPGMDGLAATELVRAQDDAPEVIVLTTFEAGDYVVRALRAGAGGFLLKDTPPVEIVRAVRAVTAGEPMLSPTITQHPGPLTVQPSAAVAGKRPAPPACSR
jgi:DNA-binding NarL/FixJ family response regulator